VFRLAVTLASMVQEPTFGRIVPDDTASV